MLTVNNKSWNSLKDPEKIQFCKENVEFARKERQKHDLKWFIARQFLDGNHYAQWNTTLNIIETPPRKRGEVRVVINKTYATYRAVQNYCVRHRPRWHVIPGDLDESTIRNARMSTKTLDYLYRILGLASKVRTIIGDGLWSSIGYLELGWDENARGGQGEVDITGHDPFDIYLPLTARISDCRIMSPFVGKVVKRYVEDVRNDPRYLDAKKDVKTDEELSLSKLKARELRHRGQKSDRPEGQQETTVYELKFWEPEGNSKGGNIRLFTFAGDTILREEELGDTDFKMYALKPDGEIYPYTNAWINGLIPINKATNRIVSQLIRHNNESNRYRVIAEKGHGVNLAATGRIGSDIEVIEHAPGRAFEQWRSYPPHSGADRLITFLERMHDDVGGSHESSMGVLPAGARSGKVLEALQAADSNNLAGITAALERLMEVLGMDILDLVADKYVTSRVIELAEPEEGRRYAKIVGAGAGREPAEGESLITKGNEVIVKIGSYLGYTVEAQRQTLLELKDRDIIDRQYVLQNLDIPNVEELSARAREEKLEEHAMKAEIAGRRGETGATPAGGDMVDLADRENVMMMRGQALPPTEGATLEHTQAHFDFIKSPEAQANPRGIEAIYQHASGELQQQGMMGGGRIA